MLKIVLSGNLKGKSLLLVQVHKLLASFSSTVKWKSGSPHESQVTKRGYALRGGKLVSKQCTEVAGEVLSTSAFELTSSFLTTKAHLYH